MVYIACSYITAYSTDVSKHNSITILHGPINSGTSSKISLSLGIEDASCRLLFSCYQYWSKPLGIICIMCQHLCGWMCCVLRWCGHSVDPCEIFLYIHQLKSTRQSNKPGHGWIYPEYSGFSTIRAIVVLWSVWLISIHVASLLLFQTQVTTLFAVHCFSILHRISALYKYKAF